MSHPIITVENLSKKYMLGQVHTDLLSERLGGLFKKSKGISNRDSQQEFWALKDVSFEVQQGEVVGIIGRNGAGKSTLLKILSRITSPTDGRVEMYGRVASLLEVGTGFHPELTGRENIFLNGAILGMSKAEVRKKFDEIVSFAEIDKFVDTPVKRYSSGMYVRLAFAVAAHLDPEILIIDEVLAVGDAEFQKKCLGKMGSVAQAGRTVLFVSHNMAAVSGLCHRAILLDCGQVVTTGPCGEVIDLYTSKKQSDHEEEEGFFRFSQTGQQSQESKEIILSLELCDENFNRKSSFRMGETILFRFRIQGLSAIPRAQIGITIKNSLSQWLGSFNSAMRWEYKDKNRGLYEYAVLELNNLPYTPGRYYFDVQVTNKGASFLQSIEDAGSFEVVPSDIYGNGYNVTSFYGITYLDGVWRFSNAE